MLLVTRSASITRIRRDIISPRRNFSENLSPADSDWTGVTDTFRANEKSSLIAGTPVLSTCIRKRVFGGTCQSVKKLAFLFSPRLHFMTLPDCFGKIFFHRFVMHIKSSYQYCLRFKDDRKDAVDIIHSKEKNNYLFNIHKYRKNIKSILLIFILNII